MWVELKEVERGLEKLWSIGRSYRLIRAECGMVPHSARPQRVRRIVRVKGPLRRAGARP